MPYIRCSDELHTLVKVESARAQIGMGEFVERAVNHFLSSPGILVKSAGKQAGLPRHAGHLDKLTRILSSGDTAAIEAVIQTVEVFFDRLRPAAK